MALFPNTAVASRTSPSLPGSPSLDSPPPTLYASQATAPGSSGNSNLPAAVPKLVQEIKIGLRLLARAVPSQSKILDDMVYQLDDISGGASRGSTPGPGNVDQGNLP